MNLYLFALSLYYIGYIKVFPVLCFAGLFLSVLNTITFMNPKFDNRIFYYLKYKSIGEGLIFLTGVLSPIITCENCATEATYFSMVFKLAFHIYLRNVLFLFVTILEIQIAIERYYTIKSTEKILVKKRERIKILLFVVLSFLPFLPDLFAYEIVPFKVVNYFVDFDKNKGDYFMLEKSKYGNSTIHNIFSITLCMVQNAATVLFLIPFNVLVFIEFRRFIKNKSRTVNQTNMNNANHSVQTSSQQRNSSDNKFNYMISIITFLFVISRVSDALSHLFLFLNGYLYDIELAEVYFFISNILFEFLFYFFTIFNFFIYYIFNKPFKEYFNKKFINSK